jgi:hypothetical protein
MLSIENNGVNRWFGVHALRLGALLTCMHVSAPDGQRTSRASAKALELRLVYPTHVDVHIAFLSKPLSEVSEIG